MNETVSGRDTRIAVLLAVAAAAVFAATLQARLMSDGIWIVDFLHAPHHDRIPTHPLFWFVQWALAAVLPEVSVETLARATSVASGGLATGLVYLACRGLGATRAGAVGAALLLVASPAAWFFATTIEYHALQMAAAAVALCVAVFAPWERRGLALSLSTLAFAPAFLSHQVFALLGPGWVLLVAWLAARAGRPFGWRALVFGVGPLLLAGLLLPQYAVELWNGGGGLEFDRETAILSAYTGKFAPGAMIWSGWLMRLALLVPVALLGWLGLRRERRLRTALLVGVGFPWLVFITVYPLPERGGFFLGSGVLWAASASFARLTPATWFGAVLLQACLGWLSVREFDSAFDPAERAEQVRLALPEGGVLASLEDLAPSITRQVPEVTELDLVPLVRRALELGLSPELFATQLTGEWARGIEQTPVAIDRSYRFWVDRSDVVFDQDSESIRLRHEAYVDALEASCEERFDTVVFDHPSWPLLLLVPRS